MLGLVTWLGGLAVLYGTHLQGWEIALVYLVLALPQTFLVLNVAHDSVHGAVSSRPWINRLLAYTYDGCGVSSYLVRIFHNQRHHFCINILDEDDPLGGRGVLRFTPHSRRRYFHRFQHVYAALVYPMLSLDYVFVRDFVDFFGASPSVPGNRGRRSRQFLALLAVKLAYLAGMIAIPIFYVGYPAGPVLLGFLLMHLMIGLLVAAAFAPTHILDGNVFPYSRAEFPDYAHHIFATTCDFATQSRLVTWLIGGLNHHIVHHVAPEVCHVHYPALTKIAKATAAEFGVPYREIPSMGGALAAHHAMLRRLARAG
ncbi:MAG: Linoleoyl-CoA desaturase [Caulobacter sp.]|nr:Linoleoyl-CoA desaturase [Caulobacter sp.]